MIKWIKSWFAPKPTEKPDYKVCVTTYRIRVEPYFYGLCSKRYKDVIMCALDMDNYILSGIEANDTLGVTPGDCQWNIIIFGKRHSYEHSIKTEFITGKEYEDRFLSKGFVIESAVGYTLTDCMGMTIDNCKATKR